MVLNEKISLVLNQAYPTLRQLEDDIFLIGSSALVLSGIKIHAANDIDILTSRKNVDELKINWTNDLRTDYKPKSSSLFRSNFARFDFQIMDIELMGGLEVKKGNNWVAVVIEDFFIYEKDGYRIKIPTLKEQKRILQLFGRSKDKKKLKLIGLL